MMDNVYLRLAEKTDAWVMSAIHIAAIKALPTTFYTRKQLLAWRNYRHQPNAKDILHDMQAQIFWVAVGNSQVRAFASFIVDELITLYVHPYYQGQGIGRALVAHFCQEAAKQGIDKVVTTASLYAEGFYVRQGFTPIKRAPHQFMSGIVVPVTKMSKNLTTDGKIRSHPR
ncbi:GNAT family N-acetyltransferase [Umezakia ovalisporum]|uniref:GNAT family N-acetyltransferase n=1 Tax=Umezakia ovalisporum TaxID=75695 RepID=UPI0024763677|nr:GNAT family N-acetyltransferase [Umezakia ovalisporum]MDH6084341.1 GNAT family N-acetyltransferase [Umezakia ovalisporum TAC611]MDH6088786.1 GNAT family N-acetyltransferase [Umezakia ovalisporum Ak1311]